MLGWTDERDLGELLPASLARALRRAFGYTKAHQLWAHLPRAYSFSGSAVDFEDVPAGENVTCVAEVINVTSRQLAPRGQKARARLISKVELASGSRRITAAFFNSPWVQGALAPGTRAMFTGKLSFFRGTPQLQHPKFIPLTPSSARVPDAAARSGTKNPALSDADADVAALLAERDFVPIYPAASGITSWRILHAVKLLIDATPHIDEPLGYQPAGMIGFDQAVREVHLPGPDGPDPARQRLKFNEAFTLACVTALRRAANARHKAPRAAATPGGWADQLARNLGFGLTEGQQSAIAEISADLDSTRPMSRLLQGEVGSGKTLVALAAMLQVIESGHQCAFLAPTEVLATQHARSLRATLERAGLGQVTVVLVTGHMPVAEKREALLAVVSGDADIVVGTHALIQDSVEFFRLGLAVVDEQHRFGVEQRDRLRLKGGHPHLLVMTATPIPRTIAMTVFGDLEVSTLRELPHGRRDVRSFVVPSTRKKWVARVPQRIREEVAAGGQAYVVAPRIDGIGGVLELAEQLRGGALADLKVAVLHGRMRAEEKERVMADFAAGRTDVLVATTVIEVGVDVPNATVMLITGAENFGVSQIHQLRGRVGRGEKPGVCFLYTESEDPQALARLGQVAATTDGFALAELDLEVRSEGNILGAEQSGRGVARLLDMRADVDVIDQAGREAAALVQRDPERARRLVAEIAPDAQEFIEKS